MYKEHGFGSIFEFAAKLGGVSRCVVEDVIRVDEKLKELPKLKSLMSKVGLSKLRRVANIADKQTENEWVKKVQQLSKSALETHIRDIRDSRPGPGLPITTEDSILDNNHENFTVKLDPQIILKLQQFKNKMVKGTTWNDVFAKLLPCAPKPQQNPKPANPKSRQASTKQKRKAFEATKGICTVSGCNKPATEFHHPKPITNLNISPNQS